MDTNIFTRPISGTSPQQIQKMLDDASHATMLGIRAAIKASKPLFRPSRYEGIADQSKSLQRLLAMVSDYGLEVLRIKKDNSDPRDVQISSITETTVCGKFVNHKGESIFRVVKFYTGIDPIMVSLIEDSEIVNKAVEQIKPVEDFEVTTQMSQFIAGNGLRKMSSCVSVNTTYANAQWFKEPNTGEFFGILIEESDVPLEQTYPRLTAPEQRPSVTVTKKS